MVPIPRSLARDLRAVFRRLAPGRAGPHPPVELATGPGGLVARCQTAEVAVEFRAPGRRPEGRAVVPLDALADAAGRDDTPVEFHPAPAGGIEARWAEAGVPRVRGYDAPDAPPQFPAPPAAPADAPAGLVAALDTACRIAAKEGARYALHRVQLRGGVGEVVASDGRQMLVQGGFTFPWPGDLLVPRTGVFAAAELSAAGVRVGRTDDHVWVLAGGWSVALRIDRAGRYPDVRSVVPAPAADATRLRLDPKDAAGLATVLPALPGAKDDCRPVTLDLNGHVAVRARAADQPRPSELVLGRSRVDGSPVRFVTDRAYLARAAALGFGVVEVAGPDRPVVCRDAARTYLWVPLGADGAVPPTPDATRVPLPKTGRRPVPGRTRKAKAARKAGRATAPAAGGDLLAEAAAVQAALRDALGRFRALARAIRADRRERRAVSATLASLRQLRRLAP